MLSFFWGRELQDPDMISSCNIIDESVVHLVVRMFPPENDGVQENLGIQDGAVPNPVSGWQIQQLASSLI